MFEQRDIILIPFPYSDLSGIKRRPALIISNENLNKSDDRICCLITSNPSKEGISIEKNNFEKGNLPFKSWIKSNRIFTIHKRIMIKKLCTINSSLHNKVVFAINQLVK